MTHLTLHQRLLEGGFRLLDSVFEEYPRLWINHGQGNYLFLIRENKEEKFIDRSISGFQIEDGRDVPEACPSGYDIEDFKKRFVVYVK